MNVSASCPGRVSVSIRTFLKSITVVFIIACLYSPSASANDTESLPVRPAALYLSWQQDPTTTMTVQWHTYSDTGQGYLEYKAPKGAEWQRVNSENKPMFASSRVVHTVEITGLEPDSEYVFRLGNLQPETASKTYRFQTLPDTLTEPLKIAIGGDIRHRKSWMLESNRVAMSHDPRFIIWGGDLAYADGQPEKIQNWYEFFDAMYETLITEDGLVIPVIMGIGNHEVRGGYYGGNDRGQENYRDTDEFREEIAPFYYNLIAFPGHPGYGYLDVGEYMSIVLLDTDHSGPIEGKQTEWLAKVLEERKEVPHLLPIYHVPGYPSVRNFEGVVSRKVREHWHPLFDQTSIRVAFEFHDHSYKRTVPIRGGEKAENGIIYLGDGNWGVGIRTPKTPEELWYLEESAAERNIIILTLDGSSQKYKIYTNTGSLLDEFEVE